MRVIIVIILFFSLIGYNQNRQVFEEANALYNDGKFAEAIDKYESILESDRSPSKGLHNREYAF